MVTGDISAKQTEGRVSLNLLIRLHIDLYHEISKLSLQGNLFSFEMTLAELSPAMNITKINRHEPCLYLGRGSGRPAINECVPIALPLMGNIVSHHHRPHKRS